LRGKEKREAIPAAGAGVLQEEEKLSQSFKRKNRLESFGRVARTSICEYLKKGEGEKGKGIFSKIRGEKGEKNSKGKNSFLSV